MYTLPYSAIWAKAHGVQVSKLELERVHLHDDGLLLGQGKRLKLGQSGRVEVCKDGAESEASRGTAGMQAHAQKANQNQRTSHGRRAISGSELYIVRLK